MTSSINKHYYQIEITGQNYSLKEVEKKPTESALSTLEKIEHILVNGFQYVGGQDDEYASWTTQERCEFLKNISTVIVEQYKTAAYKRFWYVPRFRFWYVPRFTGKFFNKIFAPVQTVFDRIQNQPLHLNHLPRLHLRDVPREVLSFSIGSFLSTRNTANFSLVAKQEQEEVSNAIFLQAQRLGYRVRDKGEARAYIQELYKEIDAVFANEWIPPEYLADRRVNGQRKTDHEKTLENLKTLSADELIFLFSKNAIYESNFRRIRTLFSLEEYRAPRKPTAKPSQENAVMALSFAIQQGETAISELLLNCGASPYVRDKRGTTALHRAALLGNVMVVKRILSNGTKNINMPNSYHATALHHVCYWSEYLKGPHFVEVARLLLEAGADPNGAVNNLNAVAHYTPLMLATHTGVPELVELLLKHKADVHAKGSVNAFTPLLLACGAGTKTDNDPSFHPNIDVVKLLLKAGAYSFATDSNGYTSLHYAAKRDFTDLAELLLQDSSRIGNREDQFGHTALHYALERRNRKMVKLLLEKGAGTQQECSRAAVYLALTWED